MKVPAKLLLLGPSGQVGGELLRFPAFRGQMIAVDRAESDLLDPESLRDAVHRYHPAIVINAAADTAVDRAETERDGSHAANAVAPAILAEACSKIGARLIHFSTDYVFPGEKESPYTEDDPVAPVNAYGQFKLEGEQAVLAADPRHLVFRLSWVYATRGRNFALTMLRLAREGKPIRVVGDQIGSPTYSRCIAEAIGQIVTELAGTPDSPGGLYHLTAAGQTSWHGFAVALINEILGQNAPVIESIPTSAYPTPARRPRFSVLDNRNVEARFGVRLPDWGDEVRRWAADYCVSNRL